MAAYVDEPYKAPPREKKFRKYGTIWAHLFADKDEEAHCLATSLGIPEDWFRIGVHPEYNHYPITPEMRTKALELGAIEMLRWDYAKFLQKKRENANPPTVSGNGN